MRTYLTDNYSFGVENLGNRYRLVVHNNEKELACRKEKRNILLNFLSETSGHLFRGRLQLKKEQEVIQVYLKGECIGSLTSTQMEKYL